MIFRTVIHCLAAVLADTLLLAVDMGIAAVVHNPVVVVLAAAIVQLECCFVVAPVAAIGIVVVSDAVFPRSNN